MFTGCWGVACFGQDTRHLFPAFTCGLIMKAAVVRTTFSHVIEFLFLLFGFSCTLSSADDTPFSYFYLQLIFNSFRSFMFLLFLVSFLHFSPLLAAVTPLNTYWPLMRLIGRVVLHCLVLVRSVCVSRKPFASLKMREGS